MPSRRDNDRLANPTEGINAETSHTVELLPHPVLRTNETTSPTSEQLYAMLRDLTRYITVLTDHQRVIQARLDILTRDPKSTKFESGQPNRKRPS